MKPQCVASVFFIVLITVFPLAGCQVTTDGQDLDSEQQSQRITPEALAEFAGQHGVDGSDLASSEWAIISRDGTAENLNWERVTSGSQGTLGHQAQKVCADCCTSYCCTYVYDCTYSTSTGELVCLWGMWGCCQPSFEE